MDRVGFEPTIQKYNSFQNYRNQPLCHLSILKAEKGIEPLPKALQAPTLPLCDSAKSGRQDLNPQSFEPKSNALTNYATPLIFIFGIDRTRTYIAEARIYNPLH